MRIHGNDAKVDSEFAVQWRLCVVDDAGVCRDPVHEGESISGNAPTRIEFLATKKTHAFFWMEEEGQPPVLIFPTEGSSYRNPLPAGLRLVLPGVDATDQSPLVLSIQAPDGAEIHMLAVAEPTEEETALFGHMATAEYEEQSNEEFEFAALASTLRSLRSGATVKMASLDGSVDPWEIVHSSSQGSVRAAVSLKTH